MKNSSENSSKTGSTKKQGKGPWIFMGLSLLLYLVVLLIDKEKGIEAGKLFYGMALEIFPFLIIVFVLMTLISLFLKPALLIKYMGRESGLKGWVISIVAGVLSMGAIYIWFPILQELQKNGVKQGLIGVFLYNRGIKLHWLPLMALYFGLKYVVVITIITIVVSIIQGIVLDFFFKDKSNENILSSN